MGKRSDGTNSRALGTNPRALRGIQSKARRMGWVAPCKADPFGLPRWLRFEVLKRDGFRCTYCGAGSRSGVRLEVDHIKPKAAGGTDAPSNLTTSCHDCNNGKAATMLSERRI